jgi:hypothetical protein
MTELSMRLPSSTGHALLAAALLLLPASAVAQSLHVSGYADFEGYIDKIGSNDKEFYFDNHHFNLIFLGQLTGDMFASAEIEYEHAGEEIAYEYGYLGYTGFSGVKIMVGKFIVPFGRFNRDLHPTWINKMIDRPNGMKNILPQTYNDVGIWASGAAALGTSGNRFVYDAWVVNGLLGDDGGDIRDMRDADREKRAGGGRSDNKMVGTRLGLDFAPAGFDIGASVQTGNYSNDPALDLTLTLLGVDAAYRVQDLELRGELVHASQEISVGNNLSKTGYYVQASYRANRVVEPVLRYSARNMDGEKDDLTRLSAGLNFYVSPTSSIRVNYHINGEKSGFEKDNGRFAVQWNIVF